MLQLLQLPQRRRRHRDYLRVIATRPPSSSRPRALWAASWPVRTTRSSSAWPPLACTLAPPSSSSTTCSTTPPTIDRHQQARWGRPRRRQADAAADPRDATWHGGAGTLVRHAIERRPRRFRGRARGDQSTGAARRDAHTRKRAKLAIDTISVSPFHFQGSAATIIGLCSSAKTRYSFRLRRNGKKQQKGVRIAQPGRALRSGRRGRRFESSFPDQNPAKNHSLVAFYIRSRVCVLIASLMLRPGVALIL